MNGYPKFQKRLKELRSERNLTQKTLAQNIGVSLSSIINYENGQRFPVAGVLSLMQQYFDVSREYLLGETDERRPAEKWDDPEAVQAIKDSLTDIFSTLEKAMRPISDEERQHIFAVLVQLCHTLKIADLDLRKKTIALFCDYAVFSLAWGEANLSNTNKEE